MPLNDNFIYNPPQLPLSIVYQDNDLIVIDKPAGLLSVPGRLPEHQDSCYLRILQEAPQAKVIHRLDMATSGLLIFAKHRDAEVAMSKLFQQRQVSKYYTALVQGHIAESGRVEAPLITDWENRPKQKVDTLVGKSALTLFTRLDEDTAQGISRVKLEPITGRSHQLRVHMAHIGHPIVGDKLYHPYPQSALNRLALHASYLSFIHPFSLINMTLSSSESF